LISLNYRDTRPIYEQVRDGLRHLMVAGAIEEGEKLPSVRALAASLSINPTTIQKAYDALEREGYLRTEAGRGCFALVKSGQTTPRKHTLLQQFDETAAELLFLGSTVEELSNRLKEVPKS